MKRIMLVGLLGGALLASTGCCGSWCRPCGPCGGIGPRVCGEPCDDGCGPACRPWRAPGVPYRTEICGECSCDPCACDSCGCSRGWYRGPLSCLFYWLTPNCWYGPNCGERYWGDFYSDPPDCYDPCDCQGNYAGRGMEMSGAMASEYYEGGCPHCGRSTNLNDGGSTQPMPANSTTTSTERVISTKTRSSGQPHRASRRY